MVLRHEDPHRLVYCLRSGAQRRGPAASVTNVTRVRSLLLAEEQDVYGDAGYRGAYKRDSTQDLEVRWHFAMGPGKQNSLDKSRPRDAFFDAIESGEARIRAVAEYPCRVVKQRVGYAKIQYQDTAKNTT